MNATTRDSPVSAGRCRVVWDAAEREVGVSVANGEEPDWTQRQRIEVTEAVAGRVIERIRDDAPGAELALDAVEVFRDRGTLVSLTIGALVQAAALHVGIPLTAAKLIGDAAGKLGRRLLDAASGGERATAVRYVDFDLDYDPSTDTGRIRPEDPAVRKADRGSRRDPVGELLAPDRHDRTSRAAVPPRAAVAPRASPGLVRGGQQEDLPTQAALRANPATPRPVPPTRAQPTARGDRSRKTTRDRQPPSRGGREGR